MAKHVIAESYTFTPGTRTIVINRWLRREQLLLITNVTRNTVIYNFSDPSLSATAFTNTNNANGSQITTVVLTFNTTAHSATDKLSVMVEEVNETFQPSELYTDPVNKFRVSQPQALIDTDFEYGPQTTKWESVGLINNRPFAYYNNITPLLITNIAVTQNSRTVTVTLTSGAPAAGTPIYIQDTTWSGADGIYMIDTSNGSTSFTYTARIPYIDAAGSIFVVNTTVGYQGAVFTGANIGNTGSALFGVSSTAVQVVTSQPHGLSVGNEVGISGITGTNPPNGSWTVSTVSNATAFTYYVTSVPSGLTVTSANVFVRPQGQFLHRAFDGGVTFSTYAQSHNQQMIRQTRRYFRYQSGKGIQLSTGTVLKPNLNIDQITSSGAAVTVVTKIPHNINPGISITVTGANETAYNGTFVVSSVINPYRFQYTALSTPSAATASGQYIISVTNWYGSTTRVGMFDNQNGIFFEFDGQTLSAVKRASTYQLSGFANVYAGNSFVTGASVNGVSTLFSKQLAPNDFIVIKGTSYRVVNILSDTVMQISPSFRSNANVSFAVVSKTVDTRYTQGTWNIDNVDGTGISGYNLDLSKMQMLYMDYSWYGAGFIRWGFRGPNGDIIYCHKVPNNNLNYEAYMRSGNLPARYETTTFAKTTTLAANVQTGDNVITVASTSGFASNGTIWLRSATASEFINYTGLTSTTFTGCTRGQAGASLTFTTVVGSNVITGVSTAGVQIGQYVTGTGIPPNAYVVSFVTSSSVTISQACTAAGSVTVVFAAMGLTAQTWLLPGTAPVAVEQHAPQFAPTISHWGTSVIMDGRYDDDKSFVFTQGSQTSATTATAVAGNADNAILSFRIAPSVSNGIASSQIGIRELANRMQMVLRQLDVFTNGQFLITLVLNGVPSTSVAWINVGGSSLAQYARYTSATTISGGEVVFGFYTNPPATAGSTGYVTTQQELALVRDLGTSILGGGSTNSNTGIFPDGPDTITIMARNLTASTSQNISARLSWTEAQA